MTNVCFSTIFIAIAPINPAAESPKSKKISFVPKYKKATGNQIIHQKKN